MFTFSFTEENGRSWPCQLCANYCSVPANCLLYVFKIMQEMAHIVVWCYTAEGGVHWAVSAASASFHYHTEVGASDCPEKGVIYVLE